MINNSKQSFVKKKSASEVIFAINNFAFYFALIFILTFIPYTGYIKILIFEFTILPILITIACVHLGPTGAIYVGVAIGLSSLCKAYYTGDPTLMFYNIDIAVVPRALDGIVVALFGFLLKINKKPIVENKIKIDIILFLKILFLLFLSVFLNTFFVTTFIYIHHAISPFDFIKNYANTLLAWLTIIYVNFLFEFFVNIIVGILLIRVMIYLQVKYRLHMWRVSQWNKDEDKLNSQKNSYVK